ncbi:RAMP superfamily CRISPR-associated protein [Carbonactinospora thermoautotrophica]|uniref:RAMP superfamily CRISPR-associated protein n=1 Tax=Carbonactinospora thermoautotrophica TaxID=1469144 RepID=UPI00082D5A78|nr:RAMP superfamily CRISPR-associated protein [Carbonactinospora thermoautotrophica]
MTVLRVAVTMLSDWHVGTGAGRHGVVDRMVQRDRDGLPYVPAKTLVGVWRDACEIAAYALDEGESGVWGAWVEYLFGSQPALSERGVLPASGTGRPREAALVVSSLHYPRSVAAALAGKPLVRTAVTFPKPGVAIDPATGRAANRLLRYEEMARAGAVLVGQAEILGFAGLDAERQRCVAALLGAGARLVESLGGKRRRGAGRCRLEVDGLAVDWDWLRETPTPPGPPQQPETAAPSASSPVPSSGAAPEATGGDWEIAELRLVLDSPLVVHERTVGNAIRSLDHVPGWVLLPAVLQRLARPEAAEAARRGDLVVTNATVEVDGRPGRPAPLALVHDKEDASRLCNLMAESVPDGLRAELFDGAYVGEYTPGRPLPVRHCPRSEHAHNTIDDAVQRPTEQVGGVYTYQAIAAGTVLRAQVRAREGLLAPGWPERLAGVWRLGRSRKDDYGRARVTATPARPPDARPVPVGPLRVWLLSDALVVDERLRPSTDPAHLAAALGRALGVTLRPLPDPGGAGLATRASEARRLESWHRRWGLPRPTLLGLRAGSCLSFEVVSGTVDPEAVRRVELAGVGLRRAEGFGQVRIGDPLLHAAFRGAPADGTPTPLSEPAPPLPPLGEHAGMVRVVEEAAWRQEIRRACEALAATRRGRVLGEGYEQVPPSQLGALRVLVTNLTGPRDARAGWWLDRLTATRGRQSAWPEATRHQLRRLLTEPDTVWEILALPEADLTVTENGRAELRERLWAEAVRTLVTDCLTAHARAVDARGEA